MKRMAFEKVVLSQVKVEKIKKMDGILPFKLMENNAIATGKKTISQILT